MPLDADFLLAAERIRAPGAGTEHVAFFLYSTVRMLRCRNVLEVGMGYTTAFLAMALHDNRDENENDRWLLAKRPHHPRASLLSPVYPFDAYAPCLHVVDDFSMATSSASKVRAVLDELGLAQGLVEHDGDFRKLTDRIDAALRFDLIWFDCGGPREYVDFLRELWPRLADDGVLAFHLGYWEYIDDDGRSVMAPSSFTNQLKLILAEEGLDSAFELLSILEPHKVHQGSVTLLRKVGPASRTRAERCDDELATMGVPADPFPDGVFRDKGSIPRFRARTGVP